MRQPLPVVPFERVLARVDALWRPQTTPHHLVLAKTRAGKTTLIKRLLELCDQDRVLVIDPKPAPDAAWSDRPDVQHTWGRAVTTVAAGFGSHHEGGGPHGQWFRLVATPDRNATRRAVEAALDVVTSEGHVVLVIDDAREVCRGYRLAEPVESVMLLGGSNNTSVILATQEVGYVPGRAQAAFTWIGHTGGWDAAKQAAALLGHTGRPWYEAMATIPAHHWCYHDDRPGNPGPCLTTFTGWPTDAAGPLRAA